MKITAVVLIKKRKNNIMCVHTKHCCREHGCKYGEEDSCVVWLGMKSQEGPCEICDRYLDCVTPKVKISEFQKRNEEANNSRGHYSGYDEFFVDED